MVNKSVIFLLVLACGCLPAKEADRNEYAELPLNISLLPGISIGDAVAKESGKKIMNTGLAWNILAGRAARLRGMEYSGIMGEYTEDVEGVQISGILNIVGGNLQGVQYAGIFNEVSGSVRGLQIAGIYNHSGGLLQGVQCGSIVNSAGLDGQGAQLAGIANEVQGSFKGVQTAGILNEADKAMQGAQFAGIVNESGGNVTGAQFAGIVNKCRGTLDGIQCAGIVNIAVNVDHGIQIGLVNVAKENSGIPIGLVSHVDGVPKYYELWGDDMGFVYTGLRSGSRKVYNLVFAGIRIAEAPFNWAIGAGVGYRKDFNHHVELNAGLNAMSLSKRIFWNKSVDRVHLYQIRCVMTWQPWERFSCFAGPTLNCLVAPDEESADFAPYHLVQTTINDHDVRIWFGFVIGIRLK